MQNDLKFTVTEINYLVDESIRTIGTKKCFQEILILRSYLHQARQAEV